MKPTRVSSCALVVAVSLAGCMATGDVEYAGEVRVTSPELVTISPGVQVIADAEEPIFYVDNNYWLYRDGYWFRSDESYRRGYLRVDFTSVPVELRRIERPQMYVQYRRHLGKQHQARRPQMQRRSQPTHDPSQLPAEPVRVPAEPVGPYTHPQPTEPARPVGPYAHPHPGRPPSGVIPTTPPGVITPPADPEIDRTVPDTGTTTPPRDDDDVRESSRPQDLPDRGTPPTQDTYGNQDGDEILIDETPDEKRANEKKDEKKKDKY